MGVYILNLNADYSKVGVQFLEDKVKWDGWALRVIVKLWDAFCLYNYKTSLVEVGVVFSMYTHVEVTCWVHAELCIICICAHRWGMGNP